jgi:class 3 adenylate cyclase
MREGRAVSHFAQSAEVARRPQSLTRELQTPLVVADAVLRQIGDGPLPLALQDGGERELRGRSGAIHIWTAGD